MPLFAIPFPAIDPVAIEIGPFAVRWYALAYIAGILTGWWYALKLVRNDALWGGKPGPLSQKDIDDFLLFGTVGLIAGGRLGYVLFYQPEFYLSNPAEIIKVWEGGLASHGGAIGVIIALWIFSRFTARRSILWILDKVVVPTALAGCFIRIGNLFNSEILGKKADVAWAFVFKQLPPDQQFPRHPVQIYESLSYLLSFFILYRVYWHTDKKDKPGYMFGLFMVLIWGFRFIWEFFKESQGGFETALGNSLTTGQWLSIPFVLIGLYFMFRPGSKAAGKA